MRRQLALILAAVMLLALCACGEAPAPEPTEPAQTPELLNTPVPVVITKEDGVLTEKRFFNSDGLRYMTLRYEYDGSGHVTRELTLGVNEAPESYIAYEYDADGKLMKESYFKAVDADNFEPCGECTYEYADGLCLRKESERDGYASLYEYEYDENALLVTEKCYEDSELVYILGYEYDANGSNTRLTRTSVMTGTESVTGMEYDAEGRLISSATADSKYTYEYNENGDETKMDCCGADGSLIYTRLTQYEYDEAGNVRRATVSQENGTTDGTVTEYVWKYAKG